MSQKEKEDEDEDENEDDRQNRSESVNQSVKNVNLEENPEDVNLPTLKLKFKRVLVICLPNTVAILSFP